jgi:hypothetical protein
MTHQQESANLSEWAVSFTLRLLTFLEIETVELFKQEVEWVPEERISVLLSGIRSHLRWQGQKNYGCAMSNMYDRSSLTGYKRCLVSQMLLWLLVPSIQVCPSIMYFPLQIETALLLSVIPVLQAAVSRRNQNFCSLQNCVPQPTLGFNLHQYAPSFCWRLVHLTSCHFPPNTCKKITYKNMTTDTTYSS